jgi:hypothetical protein
VDLALSPGAYVAVHVEEKEGPAAAGHREQLDFPILLLAIRTPQPWPSAFSPARDACQFHRQCGDNVQRAPTVLFFLGP